MAQTAGIVWKLAHHLHPDARLGKDWGLARVFEALQQEQIIHLRIEAGTLDSTSVKVHPDGTGALKKRSAIHRRLPGRPYDQDSSGCR